MTITYKSGRTIEGVLLSRTEESLRLAVAGLEDVLEIQRAGEIWLSDSEPVLIEFEWQRQQARPEVKEADCYCAPELAARLIKSLYAGDNGSARASECDDSTAPRTMQAGG